MIPAPTPNQPAETADKPASQADSTLPADTPWWARILVADWRNCWKWLSVQLPLVAAMGCEVYKLYKPQIDEFVLSHISESHRPDAAAAVCVVFALVRLYKQRKEPS